MRKADQSIITNTPSEAQRQPRMIAAATRMRPWATVAVFLGAMAMAALDCVQAFSVVTTTTTVPTTSTTTSRLHHRGQPLHLFLDPTSMQHSMEALMSSSGTTSWLADAADAVLDTASSASSAAPPTPAVSTAEIMALDAPPEAGGISYSKASYYTILALYTLSFPGLWSTIKRSTTAKVKRMTFVTPGENAKNIPEGKEGMGLRQQAGEIMACTYIAIDYWHILFSLHLASRGRWWCACSLSRRILLVFFLSLLGDI